MQMNDRLPRLGVERESALAGANLHRCLPGVLRRGTLQERCPPKVCGRNFTTCPLVVVGETSRTDLEPEMKSEDQDIEMREHWK